MNAIRQILKREGNVLKVLIPEYFKAENVELIILPFNENPIPSEQTDFSEFREKMTQTFSNYNGKTKGFRIRCC